MELGGLISTYAQNVRVELTPTTDVEIVEVLNDLNVRNEKGVTLIEADDLLSGQEYAIVVKLKTATRAKHGPRGVTLVRARARLFDVSEIKQVVCEAILKAKFVKAGKEDTTDVAAVAEHVGLQLIIRATDEAEQHAATGDFVAAAAAFAEPGVYCRAIFSEKGDALGQMATGLAVSNFGNAAAYAAGGGSEALSVKKGLSRSRAVVSSNYANLAATAGTGNAVQEGTQAAFEVPAPAEAPVVSPQVPPDLSGCTKSRRGSSR